MALHNLAFACFSNSTHSPSVTLASCYSSNISSLFLLVVAFTAADTSFLESSLAEKPSLLRTQDIQLEMHSQPPCHQK